MKILLTGGAGYIGSFMVKRLLDEGHQVIVADSLVRGHRAFVDKRAPLEVGDLSDEQFLTSLFGHHYFDAVIHFAGFISMGESMENPGMYFLDNTMVSVKLLDKMQEKGVKKFIFSSTAGVYGNPTKIPITEDHSKKPTNPYGESKLMVEQILRWYGDIHGINSVCLRYFNAAGAALDGSMGEDHEPESHLIPSIIRSILNKSDFTLYGDDYKTKDGTCVRDYIHVLDLVEAHILALGKIDKDQGSFIYNVGTGNGYSNKEVIDTVERVTGQKLTVKIVSRRPGDADTLIADSTKIKNELGFAPAHSDIETIVQTAWKWHINGHKNQ
ncbi:MAG TPA: UDP-glucose 4-epimerase GalE [Candidatus Saccharimonadales bacterium]|nr:UDP-glucose 4-epimerase GalE [Candidatus Saccharimonadales bacterium]